MNEWISVNDRHAPPMETVILYVAGEVMVGWNESFPPEDVVYVSWEKFPEACLDGEYVTHWMPLPKPPTQK